jgi:hypothetical protein
MKKILVVSKYFYPTRNTRSNQVQLLVETLSKNYSVDVVTLENDFSGYKCGNVKVYGISGVLKNFSNEGKIKKAFIALDNNLGIWWANKSSKKISQLLSENKYSIILSLSETFDSHLSILKIKNKFSMPWVTFFSDPWPHTYLPKPYYSKKLWLLPFLQEYYVKRVLFESSYIIATSGRCIILFEEKAKIEISKKSFVIPHLVNDGLKIEFKGLYKNIIYAGSLNKQRACINYIRHINDWMVDRREFGSLQFYGRSISLNDDGGSLKGVEIFDEVHSLECLKIYSEALALLLIESEMEGSPFIPSKLADYAVSGRPIIAILNKNSALDNVLNLYSGNVLIYYGDDKSIVYEKLDMLLKFQRFDAEKHISNYYDNDNISDCIDLIIKK